MVSIHALLTSFYRHDIAHLWHACVNESQHSRVTACWFKPLLTIGMTFRLMVGANIHFEPLFRMVAVVDQPMRQRRPPIVPFFFVGHTVDLNEVSSRQRTADSGQPTADSGQRTADSGQPTGGNKQAGSSGQQRTASSGQRSHHMFVPWKEVPVFRVGGGRRGWSSTCFLLLLLLHCLGCVHREPEPSFGSLAERGCLLV